MNHFLVNHAQESGRDKKTVRSLIIFMKIFSSYSYLFTTSIQILIDIQQLKQSQLKQLKFDVKLGVMEANETVVV